VSRSEAALAWVLSVAPCAAWGAARESLGDASRLALAAAVWLALVGFPAAPDPAGRAAGAARAWPRALGLAQAPAAQAARLDLQAGHDPRILWVTSVVAALLFAVLGEARHAAARGGGRGLYALSWAILGPGGLGLYAALSWAAPGSGEPFAPVAWLARHGPLGWAFERLSVEPAPAPWLGVAASGAILWAAGRIDGRRCSSGGGER
jgi:hypothetical protein